ncbi:hypothetical protein AQUCO_01300710v1 [Aquilegia coerulea]|uniref:Uncharacterized protein n=1 Tax=Aquilegia coerulea TaxID=218851 RepID=A0A2G5E2Z5_AQUCA|nr:hypothetical protein AQUCO_01300710v1 [Aquilegia coerulea]
MISVTPFNSGIVHFFHICYAHFGNLVFVRVFLHLLLLKTCLTFKSASKIDSIILLSVKQKILSNTQIERWYN